MPSNSSHTTIAVQPETRDALFYRKRPGDSYEDVIRRLLTRSRSADRARRSVAIATGQVPPASAPETQVQPGRFEAVHALVEQHLPPLSLEGASASVSADEDPSA